MGLSHDEMVNFFVNKTRLAMNSGAMFGPGGEGFMRLNVGTPRCVLEEALSRIKSALN
jgi:cystathionine beta-lyase